MSRTDVKGKARERRTTTSCGALAWRSKAGRIEVLLIKQFAHKDRWGVPKGHVNEGESYRDCAMREVKEETGLQVVLDSRLGDVVASSRDEVKTVVTYLAQVHGPDEPMHDDPDCEVADARWFDIEALPDLIVYQRVLIAEGVSVVQELVKRAASMQPAT